MLRYMYIGMEWLSKEMVEAIFMLDVGIYR